MEWLRVPDTVWAALTNWRCRSVRRVIVDFNSQQSKLA